MTYKGDLGAGQQVYIANQGTQTLITLTSSGPSQQQSQRTGLETGPWLVPPTLFRTTIGLVLRIEAAQGQRYIKLQANNIRVLDGVPSLVGADVLPLQQVAHEPDLNPIPPMEPMKPMEPLKPLSPMQPMQMRMGDMELRMGSLESTAPEPTRRFCPQCGQAISPGDRFCAYCGHRLGEVRSEE